MSFRYTGILHGVVAAVLAAALIFGSYEAGAQGAPWSGLIITANEKGHSLSVVDTLANRTRTISLSIAPHNVQTSADGKFVYVTGMTEMDMSGPGMSSMKMDMPGMLLGFDVEHPDAGPVLAVRVGEHPAHVVVDADERFAYVTVAGENVVKIVDLHAKEIVGSIAVGKMPHGLRMSPDGTRLYVSDMNDDAVSFVDIASRKELARVPAGKQPVQVAVAPDGKTVYVTLGGEDSVAAIDVATQRVTQRLRVGRNPAQAYIAPDGARLYVANQGTPQKPDHTLTVIDTRTFRTIANVEVGSGAHGVVVTPDSSRIFVTGAFASRLSEIDAKTLAVRSFVVGNGPNGVTLGHK